MVVSNYSIPQNGFQRATEYHTLRIERTLGATIHLNLGRPSLSRSRENNSGDCTARQQHLLHLARSSRIKKLDEGRGVIYHDGVLLVDSVDTSLVTFSRGSLLVLIQGKGLMLKKSRIWSTLISTSYSRIQHVNPHFGIAAPGTCAAIGRRSKCWQVRRSSFYSLLPCVFQKRPYRRARGCADPFLIALCFSSVRRSHGRPIHTYHCKIPANHQQSPKGLIARKSFVAATVV